MQTGRSRWVLSKPGVQIAFEPHGFGRHKSSGTNLRQLMNGSPVMSRGHEQMGVNPLRLQSALTPQALSQGFLQIP